jgi:uncharacterized protein YkwD
LSPRPPRRLLSHALGATLIAAIAVTAFAAPASAATSASTAEAMIIGWVNTDRAEAGLKPLRGDKTLAYLAGLRASRMASANTLSHTVGGNLSYQLDYLDVQWYRYGETIGWSSAAWTVDAAWAIYRSWMASSPHRALLMSDRFNYIGLGLAYRSSNGRTFGSAVMTESLDHTPSIARIVTRGRSGDDIAWTWQGYDPRLQTHTAGLRDYDVQYRVDSGDWRLIRDNTTATSLLLRDRAHGRYYAIRVRATDRRGNVGAWTAQSRIWVP